jgi:hypothetical protein
MSRRAVKAGKKVRLRSRTGTFALFRVFLFTGEAVGLLFVRRLRAGT